MGEPILVVRGITKLFPGVRALDKVHLELREGEVVCLVGENGAGKSTLIKILSGVYTPDEGEIILNGQQVHFVLHPRSLIDADGVVKKIRPISLDGSPPVDGIPLHGLHEPQIVHHHTTIGFPAGQFHSRALS